MRQRHPRARQRSPTGVTCMAASNACTPATTSKLRPPLPLVAGDLRDGVRTGPSPGTTTVAVVPGGTVTLSLKVPFSIRQSLTISPWIDWYVALANVRSPTTAGLMMKCLKPGDFRRFGCPRALGEPRANRDQGVVDVRLARPAFPTGRRAVGQHVAPTRVVPLGRHLEHQIVAVRVHQVPHDEVRAMHARIEMTVVVDANDVAPASP